MRPILLLLLLGCALAACQNGPEASRRALYPPNHDYFYGRDNPADQDSAYTENWDVGP